MEGYHTSLFRIIIIITILLLVLSPPSASGDEFLWKLSFCSIPKIFIFSTNVDTGHHFLFVLSHFCFHTDYQQLNPNTSDQHFRVRWLGMPLCISTNFIHYFAFASYSSTHIRLTLWHLWHVLQFLFSERPVYTLRSYWTNITTVKWQRKRRPFYSGT